MTEGFITLVKAKSNITDIIGTSPSRIFPVILPQKNTTFPAITFKVNTINPANTFDGGSTYDEYYMDLFFYGRTIDSIKDLFDTFRSEIEDSTGTYNSVEIEHIWFIEGGDEDYLDNLDLWTKRMELKITVQR